MTSKDSLRILTLSDIQGNFHAITELYNRELQQGKPIDIIIHTGNFGLWNNDTIDDYKDLNYLKQIVAFSDVLNSDLVEQLNDLSLISSSGVSTSVNNASNNITNSHSNGGSSSNPTSHVDEFNQFRSKLLSSNSVISQFQLYLDGDFKFPCPIYTIFGPLDDPKIINKFHTKEYKIPNLFLVDHLHNYEVQTPLATQPNLKLYGIGGTVKIHSLFDNGNLNYSSISGKVGELWISLIQVAELYLNVMKSTSIDQSLTSKNDNTINIFLSHAPVIKNPLLEHIAIITNADFTISQGLHFRYPVMGNGMSFVDTMGGSAGYIENYRSKFSRLRMVLGELWLIIKDEIADLLQTDENISNEKIRNLIELGLSLFDKIPISINDSIDKIVPLSLASSDVEDGNINNNSNDSYSSKKILKKINDYYFQAYYNLWHFNLCDHISKPKSASSGNEYNYMIFKLDSVGDFKLDYCSSQGFNFNFKVQNDLQTENNYDDESYDPDYSEEYKRSKPETFSITGDIEEDNSNDIGGDDDGFSRTRNLINSSNRYYRGSSRGSSSGRGRGFGGSGRGNNMSRGSSRGSYRGSKFRGRGK